MNKYKYLISLALLCSNLLQANEFKSKKIEKYLGSCSIAGYSSKAHLTYVSENGHHDGYSNKGVIIEFSNEQGNLEWLTKGIKTISLTGPESDIKIKDKWNGFKLSKTKSYLGGSKGELKLNKVKKNGAIKYEYKCYQNSDCGPVKLKLYECELNFNIIKISRAWREMVYVTPGIK